MAQVLKKENMTISIREYTDAQGQTKKAWKTIGELITWDDGKQSFETWGPAGSVRGNVFEQDNNSSQQQTPQQGGYQQPVQQPQYQQPQQAAPQQHGFNHSQPQTPPNYNQD